MLSKPGTLIHSQTEVCCMKTQNGDAMLILYKHHLLSEVNPHHAAYKPSKLLLPGSRTRSLLPVNLRINFKILVLTYRHVKTPLSQQPPSFG